MPSNAELLSQAAKKDLKRRVDQIHREAGEGYVEVGPRSRTSRTGSRRTVFTGQDGEFWQSRQFFWGQDDARTIMARAAARTGGEPLFCKITKPETQTTVYMLGDISRTLEFGFSRESKLWLLARCAVTVNLSLKSTQDNVFPALYANNNVVWTTGRPLAPVYVTRKLAEMIIDPIYSTGRLESGLVQALRMLPPRRSEVVILSDFLNLTPEQSKLLASAAAVHSVRAIVIQDDRERHLPEPPWWWPFPAPLKVFDLTSGKQHTWWLTRGNRERYTREFEEHESKLKRYFEGSHIRYEIVSTNEGHESTRKVLKLLQLPPLRR